MAGLDIPHKWKRVGRYCRGGRTEGEDEGRKQDRRREKLSVANRMRGREGDVDG